MGTIGILNSGLLSTFALEPFPDYTPPNIEEGYLATIPAAPSDLGKLPKLNLSSKLLPLCEVAILEALEASPRACKLNLADQSTDLFGFIKFEFNYR